MSSSFLPLCRMMSAFLGRDRCRSFARRVSAYCRQWILVSIHSTEIGGPRKPVITWACDETDGKAQESCALTSAANCVAGGRRSASHFCRRNHRPGRLCENYVTRPETDHCGDCF